MFMSILKYLIVLIVIPLIGINLIMFVAAGIEYKYAKKSEGFINKNGKAGTVILLHGYVGSPNDFGDLFKMLVGRGYRVIAPTIPFNSDASFAYDRGAYSANDYVQWVQKLVENEKRKTGEDPILIGFSMGGALSAATAEKLKVKKLVLIAPYFGLAVYPDIARNMAWALSWILPVLPKTQKGKINSPDGYSLYQPGTYMLSMASYYQVEILKERAKKVFPKLDVPILVIGSKNDEVADFQVSRTLCERNKNCKLVEFEKSNHVLMHDYDLEPAVRAIESFIKN